MTLYFAYGANLDDRHMAATAPGATPIGRATLENHRLVVAYGGFATVIASPGHTVPGLLWRLTPDDEAALDRFEGVAVGFYRKADCVVRGERGPKKAMIYLACDERPGAAEPAYLNQIRDAALRLSFPPEYREYLSTLPRRSSLGELDRWTPPCQLPDPVDP